MKLHWYWPFAREEEIAMASAVAAHGDEILVEVVDRDAAPAARRGAHVTVVRDLPDVVRSAGLWWPASRAITYVRRAVARRRSWRSDGFDLHHVHYINRFTDSIARLPRPLVMSVHDVTPHVPRLARPLEDRLVRRVYGRADAIVVHHRRVADELAASSSVPPDRIHVVPYPVLTRGSSQPPPPAGPPTVLLFGALRPNKGVEQLDAAVRVLEGRDLRFVIAGRGHTELESFARSMQARDHRVRAEIGFVSAARKAELFAEASVVVMPYTSFSSQSAVLHDAYGFGRPVVVTDVGALGDTVRADATGIVVAPNDPGALSGAIMAMTDEERWQAAAQRSREVAEQRSPAAFAADLRAVYAKVVSG